MRHGLMERIISEVAPDDATASKEQLADYVRELVLEVISLRMDLGREEQRGRVLSSMLSFERAKWAELCEPLKIYKERVS